MAEINEVIIDSNVLIAWLDSRDNWHVRATELITTLQATNAQPIFLDVVINETISVIARRLEEQRRSDMFTTILGELTRQAPEEVITWLSTEFRTFYSETINLVQQTRGAMNFHDAFIAVACRAFDIQFILSFDKDFDGVDWLTRLADVDAVRQAFSGT